MSTKAAIEVLERFFWAMERGEVIYPEPGCPVTSEEADRLIEYLDSRFENEVRGNSGYFAAKGMDTKGVPIDKPPEFKRMGGIMRKAFAEAFYKAREQAANSLSEGGYDVSGVIPPGGSYVW